MKPNNTIKKLKETKLDAVYGKKKHFNAADRKNGYYSHISIAILGINIFVDFVLIYLIIYTNSEILKYFTLLIVAIGTGLSAFQIHSNYFKIAEGHRSIGNRYLELFKKCSRLKAYIDDGIIDVKSIIQSVEEISKEIHAINVDAEAFPTSKKDYIESKEGIQKGEESYTNKELKL